MKATISNQIEIEDILDILSVEIRKRLTLRNPKHIDAVRMGRWMSGIDEDIFCYQQTETGLTVPRGYIRQLCAMAKQHGVAFEWTDKTRELAPVDFQFRGELRPYQKEAATAMLQRRYGVLQAPTGSGKTVMALHIIAERGQPALIIVHTKELLNQWVDRIHTFLGIPVDEIGVIGGGKMRIGGSVTVGMVQTLHKVKDDASSHIAHLVV